MSQVAGSLDIIWVHPKIFASQILIHVAGTTVMSSNTAVPVMCMSSSTAAMMVPLRVGGLLQLNRSKKVKQEIFDWLEILSQCRFR